MDRFSLRGDDFYRDFTVFGDPPGLTRLEPAAVAPGEYLLDVRSLSSLTQGFELQLTIQ